MQENHFFPGSNTPRGFVGHFDQILSPSKRKRLIVLKGGPGVGKSTFMRRIGSLCQQHTGSTEYFHCSSDPASLDAVSFPEAGVCLLDGTAPHTVDPSLPGAADGILNLGAYLDERALEALRTRIEALQREISAQFDRSACCLRACAALREDTAATYARIADSDRLQGLAQRLCAKFLPSAAPDARESTPRRLFLTAYTPDGLVSLWEKNPPARIVSLRAPWGADVSPLLTALLSRALHGGQRAVCFLDPLFPERPAQVYLPDEQLLFTPSEIPNAEETVLLEPMFDAIGMRRESELITRRRVTFELLERSACDALHQARHTHDALEALYVEHMDFAMWQQRFDETAQTLARYFAS